jgi:tetratricopeptide (TPR) repeat protein
LAALGQGAAPGQADLLAGAFRNMMADPGDPDGAVRYAREAAAQGQSRAAIATLERVLRLHPSLDNLRLELASLYLAIGSPDLAALYARQALSSPAIPPEVAVRAREIFAQAERGSARSLFEASLFAGARWESNANAVTPAGSVPIFVPALGGFLPTPLPSSGQSDWSLVLGARLAHRYDLELQREGSWETNASAFDQRFARISRAYDLTVASVDTGPRIGVAEFGDSALLALRPFATASWLGYADETYAWLYGAGLTAELRVGTRWSFELTGLARFGNYGDSSFRPAAGDYTGWETALNAGAAYALTPTTRLTASVNYVEADARVDYYKRSGIGGQLGVQSSARPQARGTRVRREPAGGRAAARP